MARNYLVTHFIQEKLKDFDSKFTDCVIKCFEMIEKTKEPDGCLSNTAALYICAKYFGYEPHICYGLCTLEGREFYHAWLELNNTVIDLAIYGNVNYSPYSLWTKTELPCIGSYDDTYVSYGKFVFDDDWNTSMISKAEDLSLEKYVDSAPNYGVWRIICNLLNKTLTRDSIDQLRPLIKNITLNRE